MMGFWYEFRDTFSDGMGCLGSLLAATILALMTSAVLGAIMFAVIHFGGLKP